MGAIRSRTSYNKWMAKTKHSSAAHQPPPRSIGSVVLLLALVLAITAQLVTGFWMAASFASSLLHAHIGVGVLAVVLTLAEWVWLLCARAGRYRLGRFFSPASGPVRWSEGAFFIVASITVLLGAAVAATLHGHTPLPFATLLAVHRALAGVTALLYLLHSALAVRRVVLRLGTH